MSKKYLFHFLVACTFLGAIACKKEEKYVPRPCAQKKIIPWFWVGDAWHYEYTELNDIHCPPWMIDFSDCPAYSFFEVAEDGRYTLAYDIPYVNTAGDSLHLAHEETGNLMATACQNTMAPVPIYSGDLYMVPDSLPTYKMWYTWGSGNQLHIRHKSGVAFILDLTHR